MRDAQAQVFEGRVGAEAPERAGLHEDIAERGGLHGSGQHGHARTVGGRLAQQRIARPAADEVDDVDLAARQPARGAHGAARSPYDR